MEGTLEKHKFWHDSVLKSRGATKSTLMEDVALSNPVITPENTTDYDAQCFLLANNTDAK